MFCVCVLMMWSDQKISFLQYICRTTVRWYPSSRMALCLSSTLTNIQAHSGKKSSKMFLVFLLFFFFLSVGGFFKVSPSNMKVPPDHYKGTHPSCWFRLPPWESVKFNCAIMVTCTGRDALKKCVCMPEQSGVDVLMQVAFTTFYITDCSLHSLVLSHLHVLQFIELH